MASTDISIVPVNYRGNEANKFFFAPFFQQLTEGELAQVFMLDPTIPWGGSRKMLLGGKMNAPLRLDTGCGGPITAKVAIGERLLSTNPVKGKVGLCKNDFERSVMMALIGKTINKDLQGTFAFNFALKTLRESMLDQIINNAFFGSTASTDETMNLADGLFSVLLPDAANNGMPVVDSFGGTALGAGDGVEYLRQIVEAQTDELDAIDASQKTLLISRAVYNQLKRDLQDAAVNSGMYSSEIINGTTIEYFDGIKMKKMSKFDSQWQALNGQANGNLAVLVADGVLQMGTDGSSMSNSIETWYSQDDEMNYLRPTFSFGFSYYSELLMVGGYKRP